MHTKSDHHCVDDEDDPPCFPPLILLSSLGRPHHIHVFSTFSSNAPEIRVMNFFCVIATSSFLWRQWPPRTKKLTISCWTYIRRRPLILYECQYGCSKITLHSESTYQSCTRIPGCGSINPCSSIDDFQKSNSMFTFDYPPIFVKRAWELKTTVARGSVTQDTLDSNYRRGII